MAGSDMTRIDEVATAEISGASLASRVRLGLMVTAALAVLTIIEYVIAVETEDPLLWLLPFALAKGLLILEYFMHLSALLGRGEH